MSDDETTTDGMYGRGYYTLFEWGVVDLHCSRHVSRRTAHRPDTGGDVRSINSASRHIASGIDISPAMSSRRFPAISLFWMDDHTSSMNSHRRPL
ncbi:unnamed protein product [Angiostrongylus costaricensis]|uniref:Transposase n=1 Tax=Angiostrongylus costaricensis TaxID=334426 RepID=A0A0R3PAA2_ANGCS|nr:unnamed protein product [Angiostrongylus costaricensis]